MIILFDESGTPTFDKARELTRFIGVAVSYEFSVEEEIFNRCDTNFGLSNRNPLKNRSISIKRAQLISEQIVELPLRLFIHSVALNDKELREMVNLYIDWGNEIRRIHRNIRPRPLSQFLYTQVLDECLFDAILVPIENGIDANTFSIFIDNWAIPINDREIYLNYRSRSIQDKMNEFLGSYYPEKHINITPLSLLERDSKRKRLIDVITSVVSRAFLLEDHIRYSTSPLELILESGIGTHEEISNAIKTLVTRMMDEGSRNPPKIPFD